MTKMDFNSDTLFSAVKRKDVGHILAFVFDQVGETKAAEIIASKTRITDAAILEVREALVGTERAEIVGDVADADEIDDTTTDADETTVDATETGDEAGFEPKDKKSKKDKKEKKAKDDDVIDMANMIEELEGYIADGKKKKAKKVFAELEDLGLKGSEMKKFKKQIKALSKGE